MKVVLYTVPGTGTRFMANILESVYGYREVNYLDFTRGGDVFTRLHTDPFESQHQLISGIGGRVITTLRDPVLAYLSRVGTMVSKAQAWTVNDSAVRWARLMAEAEKRRMFCFPVALKARRTRRAWMMALESRILPKSVNPEALEETLAGWTPVGTSCANPKKIEYLATGKIEGIDLSPLDTAKAWVEGLIG